MMTLDQAWDEAERLFPSADRFGIDAARNPAGFYTSTILRSRGDASNRVFAMIGYSTAETPAEALTNATANAQSNLVAGKDWLGEPLPNFDVDA